MPNKIRRTAMTVLLPLAFTLSSPFTFSCLAWAQPAAPGPLVHLIPAQASTFFSAFTALAQQANVAVVAEDEPLHTALTPQAVAALKLDKDGEPFSTLLPKLAAAYDYDVQPSGKAFLLKKRYTDAADLPSITVKECALALEEVNRYADDFNPHFPNDAITDSPMMKDLVYSLTPAQLEAMKDIHRGVPVASLAPQHQQEVWQFFLHCWLQRSVMDLPNIAGGIGRVAASDPLFSWRDYPKQNCHLFGYSAKLPWGPDFFMTMSKPDQIRTSLTGVGTISPAQEEGVPQAGLQLAPEDRTDPAPVSARAPKPAPLVSSSLAETLGRINARAAEKPGGDGLRVTVEPYLAPKRATLFGEEAMTPRQEVDALADVYGLRVFKDDPVGGHDRLRLTRMTARVPLDVVALHDSIRQSLPAPLVRAYAMHPGLTQPRSGPGLCPLLLSAVRQIRTAAEPRIRAARDHQVALSALSEREGRALATYLMLDALGSLSAWTTGDLPKEVTQFNDLRLAGGVYERDGKKKIDLMLQLPNPNDSTTLLPGPGVGDINYDPVNHTL